MSPSKGVGRATIFGVPHKEAFTAATAPVTAHVIPGDRGTHAARLPARGVDAHRLAYFAEPFSDLRAALTGDRDALSIEQARSDDSFSWFESP